MPISASFLSGLFAAVLLTLLPTGSSAEVEDSLLGDGWQELTFDGKQPNRFAARHGAGIDIVSRNSVSLLRMPVAVDIGMDPILHWRWCVTEAAPATDLATKGTDDRSLAIYVAFPFVAEEATAFELIERKIVEATIGEDAPGRVLMYVWGGNRDRGASLPSPHMGKSGIMKILRPADAPSSQWFDETADIADDYRQAFGAEPPNPFYIAVGADTDDTQSQSRGFIMDLGFSAAERLY